MAANCVNSCSRQGQWHDKSRSPAASKTTRGRVRSKGRLDLASRSRRTGYSEIRDLQGKTGAKNIDLVVLVTKLRLQSEPAIPCFTAVHFCLSLSKYLAIFSSFHIQLPVRPVLASSRFDGLCSGLWEHSQHDLSLHLSTAPYRNTL